MDTRIAVIAIIVDDAESAVQINEILHNYREHIIGRMGLPYKQKSTHIISVAVDAPEPRISAISGKLGMLEGVMTKTVYGKK